MVYLRPLTLVEIAGLPQGLDKFLSRTLKIKLDMSTTYHPQTIRQSNRVIQIMKHMLGACVFNYKTTWDNHLPLIEPSYNNSYRTSIKTVSFETLYSQKY